MRPLWTILCWWGGFTLIGFGRASTKYRFPIGSLFDPETVQARTAFQYAIERYNNSTNYTFKFSEYPISFDSSDSHDLIKTMCAELKKGRFLLFGITNRSLLGSIKDFTDRLNMPYLTPSLTTREVTGTSQDYVIHMRPLYHKAMLEVMKRYKWTKIFYVYDTEEGLGRLQQLYKSINTDDLKVTVDAARILDINNCYALLRNLDARSKNIDKYIILDISTEHALQLLLQQIQHVGMNRGNYHYLLGSLVMDELDLGDFKHGGVNITGFRLIDPEQWNFKNMQHIWSGLNPSTYKGAGSSKRLRLEGALSFDSGEVIVRGLEKILKATPEIFKTSFRRGHVYNRDIEGIECLNGLTWEHGPILIDAFKKVKFDGMTGPVEFDEEGFRTNFKLDVMELSLDSELTKIGQWDKGVLSMTQRPTRDNGVGFENGKNKTLVITTIMSAPYLTLKKQPEDGKPLIGNDRYEGYCVDLAFALANILNLNYVLKLVDDGNFGAIIGGNWNGMVGELTDRKADMAVAPLTINSKRERVIDFSKPFMSLGISIMIKKPEKQKPCVFSFMDPLSYEIWLCIIVAYIAVSIVLFLVSRFSPYEWQIEDSVNGPTFTNDFTILNSLWFSLGAFMRQGCGISPRSMSGRIVGSVWWFFTLIIISSYTANLAAFLTVERMLTPIESADDLAKQTEIQYGTLNNGTTKTFFEDSNILVYERMWDFMATAQPSVFVDDTKDGVKKVRESKGKYAFLLESTMNDYYNQKKPCNTMKVGDNLDSKGYGVATPLHSPLREDISLAVLQLRESGELQKLKKKWWFDKGECNADSEGKGSGSSALTLSNVAGIFYILIGGLGLSMVVSLLEFLYKSRVEAMRQKKAFTQSTRSKSRQSMRGTPERENGGYTYTAPSQIVSFDAYSDGNTHTQV